ncbi:M20/M25/M40 family metallo-hydrolase [Streptomyces sp. NPDC006464]|uniref:M20/M25/M40 family metallo-hydrolase n=1 Tax=unclassified Streptomyces TaxID=2593676 RepID=UPI0033A1B899
MDRTAEIGLLRALVDIPSVSGTEREIGAYLAGFMTRLGFDTRIDEAGNVHGSTGAATGPELLLLGHMDTVPGEVPVRVSGDVLYGRGAVDAKGPLAAMVCAAARLAHRTDARITVVGAVDEERASAGARHLAGTLRPDAVVIGEPSGAHCVGIGYKGVFRFRMTAEQPAAHTSSPEPTAAELVADLWFAVREWLALRYGPDVPPGTPPGRTSVPLFDQALPSVVGIGGDLTRAWIEVSCRVPVHFDAAAFRAFLQERSAGRPVTVIEQVPAVRAARTDPVVRALSAAIRETGARPVPKLKLGTADWNVVGPVWGVPTAAYGPGDSRLCHTENEHIALPEYLTAVDVLTAALPRLAAATAPVGTAPGALTGMGGGTP